MTANRRTASTPVPPRTAGHTAGHRAGCGALLLVALVLMLVLTAAASPVPAASQVAASELAAAQIGASQLSVSPDTQAGDRDGGAGKSDAADAASSPPPDASYRLPLGGTPTVARGFEAPAQRWSAGHRGVDLVGSPGDLVVTPAAGVITVAGQVVGRPVVVILHPDGLRTTLEPVLPTVTVGGLVARGAVVGTLEGGSPHCSTQTCLHWGVREGQTYRDPLALLPGTGPAVLLPWVP